MVILDVDFFMVSSTTSIVSATAKVNVLISKYEHADLIAMGDVTLSAVAAGEGALEAAFPAFVHWSKDIQAGGCITTGPSALS